MERVGSLINKLKEQVEQHASAEKLAITAQLLLVELQKNHNQSSVGSKISVVLPSVSRRVFHGEPESTEKKEETGSNWLFETTTEIPTLAHQVHIPQKEHKEHTRRKEPKEVKEIFEFNNVLANEVESLNEKLKEQRVEVVNALQETPVRDLKKAIGINDRYLFVHDLFRGDENMYERSIKTINSFNIYPEAQYWIQRELKVKLSWPDNSDTVKLFDQLIKRRFS